MRVVFYFILVVLAIQTNIYSQWKNNQLTQTQYLNEQVNMYDKDAGIPVNIPQLAPKNVMQNSPLALSGTYTIGVTFSGNPNNYISLSSAVADLQTQGVSGPVTFEFTDANYSDTSVVIGGYAGQGSSNPVLFKKANSIAGVKIKFTGLRTFGIRIDSAASVSFEGSIVVGQRPITFEVDSIRARNLIVISRSNNIRLEGLELIGFRRFDGSAATIIAQTSVTGSSLINSNITYKNLLIKKGSTAIGANGISNTIRDNNVLVSYCDFGGDTFIETFSARGLSVFAINNLTIFKNNIKGGKNFLTATSGPIGIIAFGGMNNLVISHNLIHNLEKTGTGAGNASGIRLQTNGPGVYTNTRIYNNMVYDLRNPNGINASAVQAIEGIAISSTSPNPFNVVEIYYNSIHLTGSLSASTPSYSAGMVFSSTLTADTVKVFNNIISNEVLTPNNGGSIVYGDFIHGSGSGGLGNYRQLANRNIYWYPDANGYLNLYSNNFADWQASTFQDANSIDQINPQFVGPTNPHININAISPADGNASLIAYITNDIDLQARSLTAPDIGADEYTYIAPSVLDPNSFAANTVSASQINLSFVKNANNNNVVIVWNLTGTFSIPTGTPPAAGQPFAGGTMLANASTSPVQHTGLSAGTKYYYKAFSFDGLGNYSLGLTADATTICDPISVPYSQSFDGAAFPPQCWQLINAGLGNNWTRIANNTYSGEGAMRYSYNPTNPANAWSFTPGFNLQAGKTYRISFFQRTDGDTLYPEKLKVTVGTNANPISQTTVLWDNAGGTNLTNYFYMERKADFLCPANGVYYFAFNCYSDADMYNLYVDEVSVIEKPAVDLSLNYFWQDTGLPIPRPVNNTKSGDSKSVTENETIISTARLNNEVAGTKSNNVNNTEIAENINIPIELASVNLKAEIENRGMNSASYSLQWRVSGVNQTTYSGPSVTPNSINTATLNYTPSARGTFLTKGNIIVSGDANAFNDSAEFRMRIYPDIFTRTIYDAGDNFVDTYVGWGSLDTRMKAGVRFTATSNIKLAGVDYICRTETVTSGTFEVQVRAAGTTSTAPGAVLYTKLYNTTDYLPSGQIGDYIHFPFDNDAPVIANGSDYWITIKAPIGILYPGAVHNSGFTTGRSFYESSQDTTVWNALVITTERAWIMRSVEVSSAQSTFPLSVNVLNGWNMVSVPGTNPDGMSVGNWWPGKVGDIYRYSGGYQSVTTTVPGIGYWMKNNGAQTYNTGDEWPAGGIQVVSHDPIPASTGWNMIGGYENSATSSLVTTVPPGLKSGFIYKYSGGYQAASTIDPGYGYWIKLTGSGQIIIPNSLAKGEQAKVMFPSDWGKLIVTDASGISYTLYSVNGEVDLNQYELPPLPPQGMFDIRYSSDRIAEDLSSSVQTIEMQGVTYPLTVRVENIDIRLMDETGKLLNQNLKKGEEIVISDNSIQKLLVSSQLIPTVYSLEQNYPNPFNPSTVIEFSLPENVENVRLTIYSILGERVAELVNGKLDAGKYKYSWNAGNVSTGMYIYELRTDKFVSVKKMMLMK